MTSDASGPDAPAPERPWRCSRTGCPAPSHDTRAAYTRGCRSGAAMEGQRLNNKRWRERRQRYRVVPAVGSRRRLQALSFNGWSMSDLAARVDGNADWLSNIARGARQQIWRETHAAIAALYDELWDVPGGSKGASGRAHAKGWVPPLAWDNIDDPEAEPQGLRDPDARRAATKRKRRRQVAAGAPTSRAAPGPVRDPLHYAEVVRLTAADHSAGFIAHRLGITARTVTRIRAELRDTRGDVAS